MSLDESSFDPHTSQPTYIIVKQSWQHPDLIGLEFLTNCITEIMSIAGLLTNMACSLTYMLALTRFIRQYTPHHVSVEFVGRQQPNGEMAQWGNMPQRGNMAQRGNSPKGKVWVHTRKWPDWGLNPGPSTGCWFQTHINYVTDCLSNSLPVNAYDPKWLKSRETLYVRHVCYLQLDLALLLICVSVQCSKLCYLIWIA